MAYVKQTTVKPEEEIVENPTSPFITQQSSGSSAANDQLGGVAAPNTQKSGGGGFTNLKRYLSANQTGAEGLGTKVAGALDTARTTAEQGINNAANSFTGKVQQGTNIFNPNLVNNAAQDASSYLTNTDLQKQLSGSYGGPSSYAGSEEDAAAQKDIIAAREKELLAGNVGGRTALLKDVLKNASGPQTTTGGLNLNQFLLQNTEPAFNKVKASAQAIEPLAENYVNKANELQTGIKTAQQTSLNTKQQALDRLTQGNTDLQNTIKAMLAAKQAQQGTGVDPNTQTYLEQISGINTAFKPAKTNLPRPTDAEIRDYFEANKQNPQAIVDATNQYGLTMDDVARAGGYSTQEALDYLSWAGITGGPNGYTLGPQPQIQQPQYNNYVDSGLSFGGGPGSASTQGGPVGINEATVLERLGLNRGQIDQLIAANERARAAGGSGINLAEFLKTGTPDKLGTADVATGEQKEDLGALAQLLGINNNFLTAGTKGTAGQLNTAGAFDALNNQYSTATANRQALDQAAAAAAQQKAWQAQLDALKNQQQPAPQPAPTPAPAPAPTQPGKPTNQEIKDFFEANKANPALIVQTANQYGLNLQDIMLATGYSWEETQGYLEWAGITQGQGGFQIRQAAQPAMPASPGDSGGPSSGTTDGPTATDGGQNGMNQGLAAALGSLGLPGMAAISGIANAVNDANTAPGGGGQASAGGTSTGAVGNDADGGTNSNNGTGSTTGSGNDSIGGIGGTGTGTGGIGSTAGSGNTGGDEGAATADSANPSGDSGAGGGSSKIICTAMNDLYGLPYNENKVWVKYSVTHMKPEHQIGYHKVFLPIVDYGFKQGDGKLNLVVRKALTWIGKERTRDISDELAGRNPTPFKRALIRKPAEKLLYLIGKWYGHKNDKGGK